MVLHSIRNSLEVLWDARGNSATVALDPSGWKPFQCFCPGTAGKSSKSTQRAEELVMSPVSQTPPSTGDRWWDPSRLQILLSLHPLAGRQGLGHGSCSGSVGP